MMKGRFHNYFFTSLLHRSLWLRCHNLHRICQINLFRNNWLKILAHQRSSSSVDACLPFNLSQFVIIDYNSNRLLTLLTNIYGCE